MCGIFKLSLLFSEVDNFSDPMVDCTESKKRRGRVSGDPSLKSLRSHRLGHSQGTFKPMKGLLLSKLLAGCASSLLFRRLRRLDASHGGSVPFPAVNICVCSVLETTCATTLGIAVDCCLSPRLFQTSHSQQSEVTLSLSVNKTQGRTVESPTDHKNNIRNNRRMLRRDP